MAPAYLFSIIWWQSSPHQGHYGLPFLLFLWPFLFLNRAEGLFSFQNESFWIWLFLLPETRSPAPSQPSVPSFNFISSKAPCITTSLSKKDTAPTTRSPYCRLLVIFTSSLFSSHRIRDYFILSLLIFSLEDWILSFMRERLCLVQTVSLICAQYN